MPLLLAITAGVVCAVVVNRLLSKRDEIDGLSARGSIRQLPLVILTHFAFAVGFLVVFAQFMRPFQMDRWGRCRQRAQ